MGAETVLFGGTFDPVHNGHLVVARALAEQRGFERISLVPAASPPHKGPPRASGEHRLAMLRLAIAGDTLFDVCELELRRGGPSYTYDTLAEIRASVGAAEKKVFWVIGADMLEDLPRWHRASEVLELAEMIVLVRPPWHERLGAIWEDLAGTFSREQVQVLSESLVNTPIVHVSSSEIRRRVACGRSIQNLVPAPVASYIECHGLSREGA